VIGVDVGLEHSDDRGAGAVGEREVFVDEVGVRVDDGEAAARLAAEQVRGAGGVVVQDLAEVDGPKLPAPEAFI
jgi:hypothetical protein